ncbi:MAG TPA: hypothetical protein VIN60_01925 [Anaerolineales bacterium]
MQNSAKHNRLIMISATLLTIMVTISCQILHPPYLGFVPNAMPNGKVGSFYYVIIKITDNRTPVGEFSITQGSLPRGIKMQRLNGQDAVLISGTPEVPGAFHFLLSVWCYGTNATGQTGDKDYILSVSP